jgi:hypothetical protein
MVLFKTTIGLTTTTTTQKARSWRRSTNSFTTVTVDRTTKLDAES